MINCVMQNCPNVGLIRNRVSLVFIQPNGSKPKSNLIDVYLCVEHKDIITPRFMGLWNEKKVSQ